MKFLNPPRRLDWRRARQYSFNIMFAVDLVKKRSLGVIEDRKEGTTVYYSLRCHCIMDFIGCIENVIRMNLERDLKLLKRGEGTNQI